MDTYSQLLRMGMFGNNGNQQLGNNFGFGNNTPNYGYGSNAGNSTNGGYGNVRFGGNSGSFGESFLEGVGGWGGALELGIGGLGTIAGILNSRKAMKNSNRQFEFAKQLSLINLQNQTKSYNTRLSDLYTARGNTEGWSQDEIDKKIEDNKL